MPGLLTVTARMLRPGDTVLSAGRVLYVVYQIWRSHHHVVIHTTSGFPVDYFEHDELTIRRH
jgi:hypothetical protein